MPSQPTPVIQSANLDSLRSHVRRQHDDRWEGTLQRNASGVALKPGLPIFYILNEEHRCDFCVAKDQSCMVDLAAIAVWRRAVHDGKKFPKPPRGTECGDCYLANRRCLLPATAHLRPDHLLPLDGDAFETEIVKVLQRLADAAEANNDHMQELIEVFGANEPESDTDWIEGDEDAQSVDEDADDESDEAMSTASSECNA